MNAIAFFTVCCCQFIQKREPFQWLSSCVCVHSEAHPFDVTARTVTTQLCITVISECIMLCLIAVPSDTAGSSAWTNQSSYDELPQLEKQHALQVSTTEIKKKKTKPKKPRICTYNHPPSASADNHCILLQDCMYREEQHQLLGSE